VKRILDAEVD